MEHIRPGTKVSPPAKNTSKPDTAKPPRGHRRNRVSIGNEEESNQIQKAAKKICHCTSNNN